jgi:hypothetical protein
VDPVYEAVGEHDEERELDNVIPESWAVCGGVVELAVTLDFKPEYGGGEERHNWQRDGGLLDLEGDLVFEIFGVLEGVFVKNECERKRCKDEIDDQAKNPTEFS